MILLLVHEGGREARPTRSARPSGLVRVGRRLAGEAGQDVVEYAGVLLLVAAIVAAVASLNLSGAIAHAASCEVKQITGGACILSATGMSAGSTLGPARPSTPGGGALSESQMERALGSNRLIFACAGNGQTEQGSDLAAQSQSCKQQLSKLSPKAISTLELLAALFQTQHDYKPASGPPCSAAQAAAPVPTCAASRQQFFQELLADYTRHPGDAVIALSRAAQQLQSGPILRNEKIETTKGDLLDGFLGSLCGGYGLCLGGTALSQAYQQAYRASAGIAKITAPVVVASGIVGALKDLAIPGLRVALARLGVSGSDAQRAEQAVTELESSSRQLSPIAGGSNPLPFTISDSQFGAKVAQHARDFGLDPASAADRTRFRQIITNIAENPDEVASGTFRGQGPGGIPGPVEFRIKGSDVVVTTPDDRFVTVLRGGLNNPSVQRALRSSR